jgi:hypothetical protein
MRPLLIVGLIFSPGSVFALDLVVSTYEDNSGDIYELKDGTVFKKVDYGYVGYLGYNSEIILFGDGTVCMGGDQFRYELYEKGSSYHYSNTTYSGAEAYAKYEEICGE